ncbi:hypothetical protein Ocin01_06543 [Orchesella cincta]|uniref:Uncharacterized protein n=1 Tax=Orchesella cincta TaxID=48709 RepID=A0A1D2N4D8_ORCCI|nr:hypothetical protein Ocin01_06543 [Orchesella cincta]
MKVAVAIAVVVACVAASLSAPITHAPDYAAVGAKVEEVVVSAAVTQIKTIANNDNAAVGSDISSQLDAAAVKATAVLERAKVAIEAQSLTVDQAQALFTELKDILAGVQTDLQDELAQLSTGAAGQIRDQFYDYAAVGAKVEEVRGVVSAAVTQIKTIANNDNAAVGSDISSQLELPQTSSLEFKTISKTSLPNSPPELLVKSVTNSMVLMLKLRLLPKKSTPSRCLPCSFLPQTTPQLELRLRKSGESLALPSPKSRPLPTTTMPPSEATSPPNWTPRAVKATAVLERAKAAIEAQSLTVDQAKALFTELKDILAGVQNDLQDELAQLSTGAAGQIRDQFYGAYAQAETLAQEIYTLLAALHGVFAPDYAAVGAKVEEVRGVVSGAVTQIKTIANNDNAAVGSDISSQLDAAAVKATAVLERAKVAIEAQSLTEAQAQGLFTELKDILAGVQTDLQDELAQLSTGAAGQIRDQFYGAYASAEALAQEIYALLRA